jgi:hypothetical protein
VWSSERAEYVTGFSFNATARSQHSGSKSSAEFCFVIRKVAPTGGCLAAKNFAFGDLFIIYWHFSFFACLLTHQLDLFHAGRWLY